MAKGPISKRIDADPDVEMSYREGYSNGYMTALEHFWRICRHTVSPRNAYHRLKTWQKQAFKDWMAQPTDKRAFPPGPPKETFRS